MLNMIGLALGFFGSLLLLIDPSMWILKDFTDAYIRKRESVVTIPEYKDEKRLWLIEQRWLRRIGILMLAAGFLLQLLAQIFSA
ncbi:hypothetical protein HNO53_20835 [Billgrantia antri]|uniref:DUF1772 domain-containing protein n=1 Tax=Halomonas sulfidivorans TaxID=2733488 RepID=A0ABX7WLU8_9GAMM|nr:hypothetical protein [Halomonas sulfidivorans]QTP60945.1 hypothetical protein HNO53_20835 [Halomonas sulfidivorans]